MAFEAVLDTSVLYPASVRDALLRLAASEMYQPRWSPSILNELLEVLYRNQLTDPQRLVETMRDAFPEALVLCHLFELDPSLATRTIEDQAAQLNKPPLTVDQVLDYISQNAPTFAENVRVQRLL